MVIGLPRSGTTWAANWLTTEQTYCAHDPLWTTHYSDLDAHMARLAGGRLCGVACTGLWAWGDWLERHPARKLILHRNERAIRVSLQRIGLPELPRKAFAALKRLSGLHVDYLELFDPARAKDLWGYLTDGAPFDAGRHNQLAAMRIEPKRDRLSVDRAATRRFTAEVHRALSR